MNKQNIIELHLTVDQNEISAIDFLAQQSQLNQVSRQNLKRAMQNGCIWQGLNQKPSRLRRAKKILIQGSKIDVYYDESIQLAVLPKPQLIEDLEQYSLWYKPYGIYSQGTKWGDHFTLNRWIESHIKPQKTAFIVHRLDRAASGLMLIAHSKKMAHQLSQLFAQRQIRKTYHAIVQGEFPNHCKTFESPIDNKPAKSEAKCLNYNRQTHTSLVEIKIHTGRKHQIRLHLSQAGFPILGDRLHGKASKNDINLQLTSFALGFICPISGEVKSFQLPESLQLKYSPSD